jgi:ABC-type transporter Mla subunit MlaD
MALSPANQFVATLSQTPTIAGKLNANLRHLKANLDQIIKVLGYSKTVDDDLTELDKDLTTANELLTFVSVIPEVGEAAAPVKEAISVLQPEVKSAKNAADKIESVVKPLRDALKKLDPVLEKAIEATKDVQDTSQSFLHKFEGVYNCVKSLPNGAPKDKALKIITDFSTTAEPAVEDLNKIMSTANNTIEEFYNKLDELREALNPLKAIISAIDDVLSPLKPLISLLESLENDLKDIKIMIPIPYPHEYSLYDVFKFFKGIAKWIDKALKPIQDLLNKILSALHIDLKIPGLSDILNINVNIPDIPNFDEIIKQIQDALNKVKGYIESFTLKCPPDSPDELGGADPKPSYG